jgi:hypothetical protein
MGWKNSSALYNEEPRRNLILFLNRGGYIAFHNCSVVNPPRINILCGMVVHGKPLKKLEDDPISDWKLKLIVLEESAV